MTNSQMIAAYLAKGGNVTQCKPNYGASKNRPRVRSTSSMIISSKLPAENKFIKSL